MSEAVADAQIQQFIEGETQKQRFQSLVHSLTDVCWDVCFETKPTARLEQHTRTCLNNCVERFIDTTSFIVNRLERNQKLFSTEGGKNEFVLE